MMNVNNSNQRLSMKIARMMLPIFALLFCSIVLADDKADEKAPAEAASETPKVISAGDEDALKAAMDKDATVEGVVSSADWSRSGAVFIIKFKDTDKSKFSAVFFKQQKDDMEKAFDGDPGKALNGAKIQVTGKVIEYRNNPEIKIDKSSQVKIIEKAAPESAEEKKDEKKDDKKE